MSNFLDQIVSNARSGEGPREGCPAHETLEGELVNPGLMNPDGDLMFVTEEPSHTTDWEQYDRWAEYNEAWSEKFKRFKGGDFISRLLEPTNLSLDDIWLADAIKCPTVANSKKGIPDADTTEAARHCRAYLPEEIEFVDPKGIVTLGRRATIHTLLALDVPWDEVKKIRVTKDYGLSDFETTPPTIISLHWAQRSVRHDEFIPILQQDIQQILS